jgi:hypothetical protein
LGTFLVWQIHHYPNQIELYSQVNNPLTEADFREYVVNALSDPKHTDSSRRNVEWAVFSAIFQRINREEIDRDEFAAWVASLPINASSKSFALRMLRVRHGEGLTFADQLQRAAGRHVQVETELTLDDVLEWFAEHPGGTLSQFLTEQDENITVSNMSERMRQNVRLSGVDFDDGRMGGMLVTHGDGSHWEVLPSIFVRALLQSDTPEGNPQTRELIRRIWAQNSFLVEHAIAAEYGMRDHRLRQNAFALDGGSIHLPEYILDLYLSPENADGAELSRTNNSWHALASIMALCESPKAGEILERWVEQAPSGTVRQQTERNLEIWRTRNTLRQMRMEFFQDLIAGRMHPDDLLLPGPPWVWVDGQYVQAE